MKVLTSVIPILLLFVGCDGKQLETNPATAEDPLPFIQVLGTLQDGGSPHAGCNKKCCAALYERPDPQRKVVSLGLVDPVTKRTWLFEASPDLPVQLADLSAAAGHELVQPPDGIFLTHAHMGHYAGLMYLGREAMNTRAVTVYVMPRFKQFLENNGPWNQLLSLKNIVPAALENEEPIRLSGSISVKPFLVPHRDEYSETVGFVITGPSKKILFIPDIDKWDKWNKRVLEEIRQVDIALLDGTFYDGREISNRNIAEIPHPFVSESAELFKSLEPSDKKKIHFIHFNHTNPLLDANSPEAAALQKAGYQVAFRGQKIGL